MGDIGGRDTAVRPVCAFAEWVGGPCVRESYGRQSGTFKFYLEKGSFDFDALFCSRISIKSYVDQRS